VPCLVIGRGTNLLVSDAGIKGVVVQIGEGLSNVRREGDSLIAGAGISLAALAQFARRDGLAGLEFAHGIPGSLGGAVVMNAGAYGGEMKDVVSSVRCLDDDGAVRTYSADELDFSYRHSRFDKGGVVLEAALSLQKGDGEEIARRMRELMEKRTSSQPLDKPSAGSTFKRPATGYAAAMIDGAGLKGLRVGSAAVSEKHAGFVVNEGGASFADVVELMERVKAAVYAKYGVTLQPEVKIING
jgi:UDP-N-acetylmuramate dehydrogenase